MPDEGYPDVLEAARSRLHRLLDGLEGARYAARPGHWAPPADIVVRSGEVVVSLEVPGVRREDIDVSVSDRTVTISGRRRAEAIEGRLLRAERPAGGFRRSFAMPWRLDPEGVQARLRRGVLSVTIPRARGKSIPVESGGE